MVRPFNFSNTPVIRFGPGKIADLPGLVKLYGTAVIIVTGKKSFINSSSAGALFDAFHGSGIKFQNVTIACEPSPAVIDEAVRRLRDVKTDVVVAIGGGSVLDAGKAISAMLKVNEPVTVFLEGVGTREHPGTKIPFIAVPTTSGTGSEATKNAVISQTGRNGFKKSLRHDNFVPDIALVDPALTLNCPPDITAASGMDCFTQLTEAFLSDKACAFTDALCIEGLKALKDSLIKCWTDVNDITARAGMSFAALTSGICLANAGLGTVHGFASSIGGLFDIPHGILCGTLMAPANRIIVRELRKRNDSRTALSKYAFLGRLFVDRNGYSDDFYIDGFIDYIDKLSDDLGMPGLNKSGLGKKDIKVICNITENKNNPVKLNIENLEEILESRL